jgi:hypothetical protein
MRQILDPQCTGNGPWLPAMRRRSTTWMPTPKPQSTPVPPSEKVVAGRAYISVDTLESKPLCPYPSDLPNHTVSEETGS